MLGIICKVRRWFWLHFSRDKYDIKGIGEVWAKDIEIYMENISNTTWSVAVFYENPQITCLSIWKYVDKEWIHLQMRTRGDWKVEFKEQLNEVGITFEWEDN